MLSTEVDIRGRHVVERLVVTLVVVVGDEVPDRRLQLPWEVIVLELDHVLHRSVIALDLALRLRVVRSAAGVAHAPLGQILPEFAR